MTDLSQFRALFGFGDEVTDEQLSARLQASGVLPAEPGETDAQTPPQDATGGTAAGADGAQATGNPPAAPEAPQAPATAAHADTPAEGTQPGAAAFSAGLPEGLTAIRTEDLQALQLSAQRADALFQDATKQRHEQIVAAAFNAGRITNPEREVFLSALSENERLATQILDARPRMFSTSESGSPFAPSVDTDTDDDDELEKLAAENGI